MAAVATDNISLPGGIQSGHATTSGTTPGIPSAHPPAVTSGAGQTPCPICGRFRAGSGTGDDEALDPVQWRATSPYTSFGLDIGGTLCKLVYFEPNVATSLVDARDSCTAGKGEGLEGGGDRGGWIVVEPPSKGEVRGGEANETNALPGRSRESDSGAESEGINDGQQQEFSSSLPARSGRQESPCSCPKAGVESSQSRAKKMWRSSHHPIHLSGRGTLFFKRFGKGGCTGIGKGMVKGVGIGIVRTGMIRTHEYDDI